MTMFVHDNALTAQVLTDLHTICPDPGLQVDVFTDPGPPARRGTGEVTFKTAPAAPMPIGCETVWKLVTSSCRVLVRGEATGFSVWPAAGELLRDMGGDTVWDTYPGTTEVEIVYDTTLCNGKGYWVESAPGVKTADPGHVILFHELAHAREFAEGALGTGPVNPVTQNASENRVIAAEGEYRALRGMPRRVGHTGGGFCTPATPPPGPHPPPSPKGGGCFIATAAYGSALEPEVELLRRFRDDVLLKTRSGATFFEKYWKYYYRVSPGIAEEMHADPELKEIVRWSIVTPIVEYLRLLLRFPDQPLDAVPEPWKTFLLEQRSTLVEWVSALDLPLEFRGRSAREAAEELAVLLAYALRTPDARDAYLDQLEALGELPLSVCDCSRAELRAILRASGRTDTEIERVLGRAQARKPARGIASFGDHLHQEAQFDPGEWFYTVTITNNSQLGAAPMTFDEVALFYKRKNLDGVVFMHELDVQPTQSRVFNLGVCSQMESYAFGAYGYVDLGGGQVKHEEVAQLPAPGDPPITPDIASQIKPSDQFPCEDSWSIEP